MINLILDKTDGTFGIYFKCEYLENTSGYMRISSDLYLIYMVSKNVMPIQISCGARVSLFVRMALAHDRLFL